MVYKRMDFINQTYLQIYHFAKSIIIEMNFILWILSMCKLPL